MSKINKSKLTSEQKLVLLEEGTEPPGSSNLNNEKRIGSYHCAGCDENLFESDKKILSFSLKLFLTIELKSKYLFS